MNQPKSILGSALILGIVSISAAISFGQADAKQRAESSFEVSLQVVIGSNDAGQRSDFPSGLSSISKQLRTGFAFSNYRVANTFLGRISDTGNFEYRSVSNILGQESGAGPPTILEWIMNDLRSSPNAKGQAGFQARAFRFGIRFPAITANIKDESGKVNPVINYEGIGLTLSKVGLAENVPTLLGTLSLPGTTGTIFLVVTIRTADQ